MIGANLRFGIGASGNITSNATKVFQCHPGGVTEATVIFSLGALGMGANIVLMTLILLKRQLRRYEYRLLKLEELYSIEYSFGLNWQVVPRVVVSPSDGRLC